MTGAWQLQGQDKSVLLFANVSDDSLATHLQFNSEEYGFAGKSLKVVTITPTGLQDRFNFKAGAQPELKLTARTVLAWEMTPLSSDDQPAGKSKALQFQNK
jgi:hypothetical protein